MATKSRRRDVLNFSVAKCAERATSAVRLKGDIMEQAKQVIVSTGQRQASAHAAQERSFVRRALSSSLIATSVVEKKPPPFSKRSSKTKVEKDKAGAT